MRAIALLLTVRATLEARAYAPAHSAHLAPRRPRKSQRHDYTDLLDLIDLDRDTEALALRYAQRCHIPGLADGKHPPTTPNPAESILAPLFQRPP